MTSSLPRPTLSSSINLPNVYSLDMGAMPMVQEMRRNGIRVNLAQLKRVEARIIEERDELS